ncbi:hypothetical protein DE146DRAFT_428792 [Phaeosphaeria sp. MPI-PUGE-AT-0046c]|nr:hypothetical protein DE146DRAFT_428792 [Phaeosphaeria sp. MPI-PUGE-AT-0046c]
MASSLVDLPPEILIPTLALLPNRSILKFSQCSRYARALANSSLHTLNVAFRPSTLDEDLLLATQPSSVTGLSIRRKHCTEQCLGARHMYPCRLIHQRQGNLPSIDETQSDKTIIRVPNADLYEYGTLVNFHSALLSSILGRHHNALQDIDISIWALTTPIAKAVARVQSLRKLSITIQECFQARGPQRRFTAEQTTAWDVLCTLATSNGRLSTLRIEKGNLTHLQLFRLLANNPRCYTLQLLGCGAIGKVLWEFLGGKWEGRNNLRALTLADCGGTLGQATLENIGKLKGLETLDLQGCTGVDAKTMKEWNRSIWNIPHLTPPRSYTLFEEDVLEVDSAYEDSEDEQ